jgi:hypothetical protein
MMMALLATGCVTGEDQTWSQEGPLSVAQASDDYATFGYRGESLEVTRLRQKEVGFLDGVRVSDDGQWAHLSTTDVTCTMTRIGNMTDDEDVEEDAPEETVGTGPGTQTMVATPDHLYLRDPVEDTLETWALPGVVAATGSVDRTLALDADGVLHELDGVSVGLDDRRAPDLALVADLVLVAGTPVVAVTPAGGSWDLSISADHIEVDPATGLIVIGSEDGAMATTLSGEVAWSLPDIDALDVGVLSDRGVAWVLAEVDGDRNVLLVDLTTGADLGMIAVRNGVEAVSSSVRGGLLAQMRGATLTLWQVDRPQ